MKKISQIVILFTFLATNITAFAQDKATLEKETQKMYDASINLKYDLIVNYTYPRVFETVPKDKLIEVIKQAFENDMFSIEFLPIPPNFEFGEFKNIDNKKFCLVNYNIGMLFNYYEELDDETIEMMLGIFGELPNYNDVKFDKEKNAFILKGNSTMIAVSDELTKNQWKFVNFESKNRALIAQYYLSDDILTKLGL